MFAGRSPEESLSLNTSLDVLPPLTPESLNFEQGLKVVNRTTRFVVPVPSLVDGGEPLIYPWATSRQGEAIKLREDGTVERGIVFFNGKDRAWQAVRGNGQEAILINDVSREQAEFLTAELNKLGGAHRITIDGVRTLMEKARGILGITDFYDKKMAGVNADMAVIDPSMPYYRVVTKPAVHSAIYVRTGFTFAGPVPQVYPEGAVIVNDGKHSWGVDAGVFQRNFKAIEGGIERALEDLEKEFPVYHPAR